MKRALAAMSLVCLAVVSVSAQSAQWRLAGFIDGKPDRTMSVRIDRHGERTTITSIEDGRAISESVLDENGNPISHRTFAWDCTTSSEVTVGEGRRIAARCGGREWNMESQNAIVLSDPFNFWVFSLWLSREPGFKEKSIS